MSVTASISMYIQMNQICFPFFSREREIGFYNLLIKMKRLAHCEACRLQLSKLIIYGITYLFLYNILLIDNFINDCQSKFINT